MGQIGFTIMGLALYLFDNMAKIDEKSVGIVETKSVRIVAEDSALKLRCGKELGPIDVAYETYGELNEAGDNAILICHALSGTAHVAGFNSENDEKPGWWDTMIGPGKGIDTNKYFVICSNFLGGCSGTTGPGSMNPKTGKPYGLDFPIITVADMVKVQKLLLDKIGVRQLLNVVGGSMGGMQVLRWTIDYPEFVKSATVIAATAKLGPQSIAFDAVGRNAILADPNFADGDYHGKQNPDKGLAIARMIGHITYLSERGMHEKFGRQLRDSSEYKYEFDSEFAVETYLDYQGQSFIERFDANSYLYITKSLDYFDLEKVYGSLDKAFSETKSKFLVMSFSSDWLFTPRHSEEIVDALLGNDKDVSYSCIKSEYGHDAFLLETEFIGALLGGFLQNTHRPGERAQNHIAKSISEKSKTDKHHRERRVRVDYELIDSLIEADSSVLDVGCGDGELLAKLKADKNIRGKGVELTQNLVLQCVNRGLAIIRHDIENGLWMYGDKSFDYLILSQTVQTVKNTEDVLTELLRIGKKVIVSFPNFANWKCRLGLIFGGKAPVTKQLPFEWYNSPNIHCLTLKDFDEFCEKLGVKVEERIPLIKRRLSPVKFAANLLAEQAVYVISKD